MQNFPIAMSKKFIQTTEKDIIRLTYAAKDLDPDELRLSYTPGEVILDVSPICRNFLVANMQEFLSAIAAERQNDISGKLASVRWETCTLEELDLAFNVCREKLGTDERMQAWHQRAKAMFLPLNKALTELRGAGKLEINAQTYWSSANLDSYISISRQASAPIRQAMESYLKEIPGYNQADAQNGRVQPMVYQNHGYLTMHILSHMLGKQDSGMDRSQRIDNFRVVHSFEKPIKAILRASFTDYNLVVDLVLWENPTSEVNIYDSRKKPRGLLQWT